MLPLAPVPDGDPNARCERSRSLSRTAQNIGAAGRSRPTGMAGLYSEAPVMPRVVLLVVEHSYANDAITGRDPSLQASATDSGFPVKQEYVLACDRDNAEPDKSDPFIEAGGKSPGKNRLDHE